VAVSPDVHAWGPDVEVFGALGHGRSYGVPSRFLVRTLPGILESALWHQLSALPPAPTRGIVTDVGNDILYGFSPSQILAWVEETLDRLQGFTDDIVLTDLPLASLDRLSNTKFLILRSVLFPRCRLSLAQVAEAAIRVNDGLTSLAEAHRIRFSRLKPEWYGFDPIHIRPSRWHAAWQEILSGEPGAMRYPAPWREGLRLHWMRPERQWLFGREQVSPQTGVALPLGGRVWLY
jgi:hypothetical protein